MPFLSHHLFNHAKVALPKCKPFGEGWGRVPVIRAVLTVNLGMRLLSVFYLVELGKWKHDIKKNLAPAKAEIVVEFSKNKIILFILECHQIILLWRREKKIQVRWVYLEQRTLLLGSTFINGYFVIYCNRT